MAANGITALDTLAWGTSLAETTSTLGADRLDTRTPPDQYHVWAAQISACKNLLLLMSQYFKGGARLKVIEQASNPFGAGESGLYLDTSGLLYKVHNGTSVNVPTTVATQLNVKDFGAVGDGNSDDTSAFTSAIAAAAAGFNKTIFIPAGKYKITSTLLISNQGLVFQGRREGRPALTDQSATSLEFYGTGACIQLGTDTHSGNNCGNFYDGQQGFTLKDISLRYVGVTTSNLLNGQGVYGTGTMGLQDWRGGDVHLSNVTMEHFQYGFYGINSDINDFDKVEFFYCSTAIYAGPRTDQFSINALYGFFNDCVLDLDTVYGTRITNSQFVDNGSASTYPIKIHTSCTAGCQGITFENNWFEHFLAVTALEAFVDIGDGDSYVSSFIRFTNNYIITNTQGTSFHAKYFIRADQADCIMIDEVSGLANNMLNLVHLVGTGSPTFQIKVANQFSFSQAPVTNNGSGTIKVFGQYWGTGGSAAYGIYSPNALQLTATGAAAINSTGLTVNSTLTSTGNIVASGSSYIQSGTGGIYSNGDMFAAAGHAIDVSSAGTLGIGTTNATSLTLGGPSCPPVIYAGTGTQTGNVPCTIYKNMSPVSSVTTGETDAQVYTMPANTLSANGQKLTAKVMFSKAANANSITMKFYFAGTAIFSVGDTISGDTPVGDIDIVRLTSSTAQWSYSAKFSGSNSGSKGILTGLDFTSAIILKSSVTGATANGDLTSNGMRVEWWP